MRDLNALFGREKDNIVAAAGVEHALLDARGGRAGVNEDDGGRVSVVIQRVLRLVVWYVAG